MSLFDTKKLSKLTIDAYLDAEYRIPVGRWEALFNPTQLAYSRTNEYEWLQPTGASKPQLQYKGGTPDEISLEFFFDGTGVVESDLSVRTRIETFLALTSYQGEAHQPFYLHLNWSAFNFRGIRTKADVTYTVFDRNGEPLRATLAVALREALPPEEVTRDENNSSPDLFQTWLVAEGETLEFIANRIYGDPGYWRPIATANRLVNPLDLPPGMILTLPPRAA